MYIERYGVKYAQEFVKHNKIDTTSQYCRKLVDNEKKKEIIEKCFSQFFGNKPIMTKDQLRLSSFL